MYLRTLDDLTRGNLRSSDGMDTHLDSTWAESALQRQGSWEIDWAGAWIGLQGGDVIGTCGESYHLAVLPVQRTGTNGACTRPA